MMLFPAVVMNFLNSKARLGERSIYRIKTDRTKSCCRVQMNLITPTDTRVEIFLGNCDRSGGAIRL